MGSLVRSLGRFGAPRWALLLALVWGVLGPQAPRPAPTPTPGRPHALDGDTIRLADGRRVRLTGVDTPETGRPGAERATGAAAAFLQREGDFALMPTDPPSDRYGRLLADVTMGGESLSAHLLERGLAWLYRGDPGSWLDTQRRAVEHRRGVHRGLDSWAGGGLVITTNSFHDPRCRLLRSSTRARLQVVGPEVAFKQGLAPCRGCLPWPPLVWTVTG